MASDSNTVSRSMPIGTETGPTASYINLAHAINVSRKPEDKAQLCRALHSNEFSDLAPNDHLGMLCRKLGYGVTHADRAAFLKAECTSDLSPGLCIACLYLHPFTYRYALGAKCSRCKTHNVSGCLTLAGNQA